MIMRHTKVTKTVLIPVFFTFFLFQSEAEAKHYVMLSITKDGLKELRLSFRGRLVLETSLASDHSSGSVVFSRATDGIRVVETVIRYGAIDDCAVSSSSQDIHLFTSEFSKLRPGKMANTEDDIMNYYLDVNKLTNPVFLSEHSRDFSEGMFNSTRTQSSVFNSTRTQSSMFNSTRTQSSFHDILHEHNVSSVDVDYSHNVSHLRLSAEILSAKRSLFVKMMRPYLQIMKNARECRLFYEKAKENLEMLTVLAEKSGQDAYNSLGAFLEEDGLRLRRHLGGRAEVRLHGRRGLRVGDSRGINRSTEELLKESTEELSKESRDALLNGPRKELLNESKKELSKESGEELLNEPRKELLNESKKELFKESKKELMMETKRELLNESKRELLNEPLPPNYYPTGPLSDTRISDNNRHKGEIDHVHQGGSDRAYNTREMVTVHDTRESDRASDSQVVGHGYDTRSSDRFSDSRHFDIADSASDNSSAHTTQAIDQFDDSGVNGSVHGVRESDLGPLNEARESGILPSNLPPAAMDIKFETIMIGQSEYKPTAVQSEYKPTAVQSEYKPTAVQSEYKPTAVQSEYKPTAVQSEYKPTAVQSEYKPTAVQSEYKPTAVQSEYKPTAVQSEYKPTAVQSEYKPTAVQSEYKPTTGPSEYKPTAVQSEYKPTAVQSEYNPTAGPSSYKPTSESRSLSRSFSPSPTIPSTNNQSTTPKHIDSMNPAYSTFLPVNSSLVNKSNGQSTNTDSVQIELPRYDTAAASSDPAGQSMASDGQSRGKRDLFTGWMIFPGTKWCGDGDIAEHKKDVGYHVELDKCCRRHDLCPLVIPRLTWKYGMFNYRLHTLSHCRCDRKFRKCLKASTSPLAHLIGKIYFNVVGPQCFKFTQKSTCVQRYWWGGCREYANTKVAFPKRQRSFK